MDERILREALDAARSQLEALETQLITTIAALEDQQRQIHVILSFVWAGIHLCEGPAKLTEADRAWAHTTAQRLGMI